MDTIKKLLSESSDLSCMRAMSLLSLLLAGAIAVIGLIKNVDLSALSLLVGVFVAAAFGGKVGQKFAEVKENSGE